MIILIHIKHIEKKPKLVEQYSLDGNFISVHESVRNAGKTLGVNYQPITQVCRGERKTAYGFIWRYVEDRFTFPDLQHNGHCKKVYKYNRECHLVYVYQSATEAALKENVNIATIINQCNEYTNGCRSEYIYSYEELTSEQINNKFLNKKYKKINMYGLDNDYICTFDSIKDGANFIGIKNAASLISNCCTGRKKTAYGYKWFHANNVNQPNITKIIDY